MQNDSYSIEFVWPGLIDGFPAIAVHIIMPFILLFGIFKYTKFSTVKKIFLTPIALIGPMLLSSFWPLVLSLSGFLRVASSNGQRRINWTEATYLFGHQSIYIWLIPTFIVVIVVFQKMRNRYLEFKSKNE